MPTVDVLLFAGLREIAHAPTVAVELGDLATAGDLLAALGEQYPALAPRLPPCRVALDHVFVRADEPVAGAREIAVIPPVSGGHDGPLRVAVLPTPLQLSAVVEAVEHAGAGGIATFTGNVRRQSRGQTVEHLEYEAYVPMALQVMDQIRARIETEIEGTRVAIHHRIGRLEVGETAVVIAASAPHRAEAFAACREAIEALKRDVPIWKREVAEGGAVWIGQGP
ncbi:molybdenum cofactor biosynthesis protein [Paraliomyxa miuraensis]|uniref:molybdenum cofactor biosynthesis protein n=1 Tax=Paraliomyxa miuraensis TaxID=376150 RepID=UPI00224DB6B1|nr:molybdenum cofactor biosynthesis protein MoaE [Paraliomyxa miuraensis]MCX4245198.1 molybdenum cofactor biosynthesis protein MoaE [Paraliomyxa miuraensis]